MNFNETRYDESDHDRDSYAREVADIARDERDMEDVLIESTPRETNGKLVKCCDNPALYKLHKCLERDLDTGAFTEDWYECGGCGSRIGSEDFAMICSWANKQSTWAPITEETAGPVVPEVDVRPIEFEPARASPRKVA